MGMPISSRLPKQAWNRKKAKAREPYEIALRSLEQVESMGRLTLGDKLAERAMPQLEEIAQRWKFMPEKWPSLWSVNKVGNKVIKLVTHSAGGGYAQ